MASVCGNISGNLAFSCTDPLQAGTGNRSWVFNFDDILDVTKNLTNKLIVEDIALKSTKQAYYVDGNNNSIAPTFSLIKNRYTNVFDHSVNMKGFDISPAAKDNLNAAKDGKFVVIVENLAKGTTGNTAFEIYGLEVGLEMTVLTRDPLNADTQGAFDFTFATNLNKAATVPHTFFITDYATTLAAIEALLTPAP